MTQENEELLLKDLCSRLPYGVKVQYDNKVFSVDYISPIYEEIKLDTSDNYTLLISDVKPYLYPLSSMTEEQSKIYHELIEGMFGTSALINFEVLEEFFYKNHIDFRGLIRLGLAKDSTGLNIY